MRSADDTVLRNCLISDARAYEASKWFVRAKQRLEKQEKKIRLRMLWHQLMHQAMLKKKVPNADIYKINSLKNHKCRLSDMQLKWRRFAALTLMSKRIRDRLELLREYESLRHYSSGSAETPQNLWKYFVSRYRIANVVRTIKRSLTLRGRDRWRSLARRLNRRSMFESLHDIQSQIHSGATETELGHSSIAVQASGIEESENYSRWHSFLSRARLAIARAKLSSEAEDLMQKRRKKSLKQSWLKLTKRLHHLRETEDLSVSAERLQSARDMWDSVTEPYRRKKQRERLVDESNRIHTRRRLKRVWRTLAQFTRLRAIHVNVARDIHGREARKVGVEFLMKNIPNLEGLVRENVNSKISNFRRTIPSDFWHNADILSYSLTRQMLWESANAAASKVSSQASTIADTFSKCQVMLTSQKTSHALNEASDTPHPKRKNIHVIVGFGFGDEEVSLLDSPSSYTE